MAHHRQASSSPSYRRRMRVSWIRGRKRRRFLEPASGPRIATQESEIRCRTRYDCRLLRRHRQSETRRPKRACASQTGRPLNRPTSKQVSGRRWVRQELQLLAD